MPASFLPALAALVLMASAAAGDRPGQGGHQPRASAVPALAASARASPAPTQARTGIAAFHPGVVLLAFHPGVSSVRQQAIEHAAGGFDAQLIGPPVRRARLRATARPLLAPVALRVTAGGVPAAVHRLRRYREVAYAEPDYLMRASAVPNDAFLPLQWASSNTGQAIPALKPGGQLGPPASGTQGADDRALLAWGVTTGSSSIVIGEVDTGVDYEHPDLAANIWTNPGEVGECPAGTHGYNVLANKVLPTACEPIDEDTAFGGHGTHVAGIMGAIGNNASGVAGVNWNTTLLPVKWLESAGVEGTNEHLIAALQWLLAAKQAGVNVRVVNDSATFVGTKESQALSEEIKTLGENNILFVTAAGNTGQEDNSEFPRYPCEYGLANEICVTASDHNDQLPSWANYGAHTVDLAAPGVSIYSTLREGAYGYLSGGSMAAPQVAGAAALILSVDPSLSAEQLKTDILENVDKLPSLSGRVITGGRLDVCRALPGCTLASAETTAASSITQSAATLNATVDPNGVAVSECRFEYGLSASYGSSVPCSSLPGSGTAPVAVSGEVEGLSPSTTYHFRIVASNRSGPAYGADRALATLAIPLTIPPPAPELPTGAGAPAGISVSRGVLPSQQQKPVPDSELTSKALFVGSTGIVSVKVACPPAESACKGTVTLRARIPASVPASGGRSKSHRTTLLTLAAGSFTVAGGQTRTLRMRLSAQARSLLARLHVLHARATIVARDPTGATHTVTSSVTLRLLPSTPARPPARR